MTDIQSIFFAIKQIGLAVAGASLFWMLVFERTGEQELSKRLKKVFTISILASFISFIAIYLQMTPSIFAHEGLSIFPDASYIKNSLETFIIVSVITYFLAFVVLIAKASPNILRKQKILALLFIAFTLATAVWNGNFDRQQLFFIGHNIHSIFTFGTVIILDYLFFLSHADASLGASLSKYFRLMSKFIWAGLAVDFISVSLIWQSIDFTSTKSYFIQIVLAILIINGALLSGPLSNALERALRSFKELNPRMKALLTISGAVSVSSWTTMYVMDFFQSVPISFEQLFALYIMLIGLAIIAYELLSSYARVR